MLAQGVARVKREKGGEGMAKQLAALQAELKDGVVRAFAGDGGAFGRSMEELAGCVGRALGQAAKSKGGGGAVWVAVGKAWCTLVVFLCRRAARLEAVLALEQSAVQSVTGALLKALAWPECSGNVLRAVAWVAAERGHMMTKEAQDLTVTQCLKLAAAPQQLVAPQEEEENSKDVEEDLKDEDRPLPSVAAVRVDAPAARTAKSDERSVALQCLHALAKGARRKSHFVELHLKTVSEAALANVASAAPIVARGGAGASVLSGWLQLLEALIVSGGNLFSSLFQQRVHSVAVSMCLLLFSSAIRGDETAVDGFSSYSEGGSGGKLTAADKRRIHAILVLAALASGPCFKQFSNDMLALLPYSTHDKGSFAESNSLYALLLHDGSQRIRMHAILLLQALLKSSKQFFSVAMDHENPKQASFISLSEKLALTLRDLHKVLDKALAAEEDVGNRMLLLRTVPMLVNVTPYDRLAGCATELAQDDAMLLLPLLKRIVTEFEGPEKMGCILNVLRVRADIAQVRLWIRRFGLVSFLVGLCADSPQPLAEACLIELCGRYGQIVAADMIEGGVLVRLLSRKEVSAELLQCAQELSVVMLSRSEADAAKCWQSILQVALPRQAYFFRESTPPAVSAAFVMLLASVPSCVWTLQDGRVQVSIVAAVSSAFDAEESPAPVRLASLRGVGQLLMLEELVKDNERFLTDAHAMISRGMASGNEEMSEWAYWALGNLAQALNAVLVSGDDLMIGMLLDALKTALASVSTQEKVRCSCLRVLGKAAQRLRPAVFEPFAKQCLERVLEALGSKEKAKIRWNGCNALLLVLEQKCWDKRLYGALTDILTSSTNYKERISAVCVFEQHLWIVADADSFGPLIVKCILAELECSKKEKDLSDKYLPHLRSVLLGCASDATRDHVATLIRDRPFDLSDFGLVP